MSFVSTFFFWSSLFSFLGVLCGVSCDVLWFTSLACFQVRKKTLDLAMELVTSRTVEELVLVLKKEVTKTHNTVEHEDVGKYAISVSFSLLYL